MKSISVTEYLNYEGGKFSKSRSTGESLGVGRGARGPLLRPRGWLPAPSSARKLAESPATAPPPTHLIPPTLPPCQACLATTRRTRGCRWRCGATTC
jgi:hypothetical protein